MKIKIFGLDNAFELKEENVNIISISNVKMFSNVVKIINNKINGIEEDEIILLDDENKEINMKSSCMILLDLFNFDFNSKKILNKLYDVIEEKIKLNQDLELDNYVLNIRNYLIEEINELPFEFSMKSDLDISEVLKLFNVKIDTINYESILEKIEFFMDLLSTLKIANIIFVPNLKEYLDNDELIELYKYALYSNIKLIIIERKNSDKLKYERIWEIDENYCDIIY